jgi:hypothetical protein
MQHHQRILDFLQRYLRGLHEGDHAALRVLFHPEALLFGAVRGQSVQRTLDAYLEGVASRASANSLGEPFRMAILSVEVLGDMASAKVHVPMLGFNYYNFLSLRKQDGQWRIVNKSYAHLGE